MAGYQIRYENSVCVNGLQSLMPRTSLTSSTGVPWGASTTVPVDQVRAGTAMLAWIAVTFVNIYNTITSNCGSKFGKLCHRIVVFEKMATKSAYCVLSLRSFEFTSSLENNASE